MSITASIPITLPTTRKGAALALSEIASVNCFIRAVGAPSFTQVATLKPSGPVVYFIDGGITPGDYEFYADVTDTQNPPVNGDPSSILAFSVPVPVVILPPADAPTLGAVVLS